MATILQQDKTGAAKERCIYVKHYVNNEAFATAYAKAPEAAKPGSEPYRMDAAGVAGLTKRLKEMEEGPVKIKATRMPASGKRFITPVKCKYRSNSFCRPMAER